MAKDIFRPRGEPARTIYDAFQAAATERADHPTDWVIYERNATWAAACEYADTHNLRVPTLRDVLAAEQEGMGHIDYGAKMAYALARTMQAKKEEAGGKAS